MDHLISSFQKKKSRIIRPLKDKYMTYINLIKEMELLENTVDSINFQVSDIA